MFGRSIFGLFNPRLACVLWRAADNLERNYYLKRCYIMPGQLTAARSIEIIEALVAALKTTRDKLAEANALLAPTGAALAAAVEEDAAIEAALTAALAALQEEAEPAPADEPAPDEPAAEEPTAEPAPAEEPAAEPAAEDPAPAEDPASEPTP